MLLVRQRQPLLRLRKEWLQRRRSSGIDLCQCATCYWPLSDATQRQCTAVSFSCTRVVHELCKNANYGQVTCMALSLRSDLILLCPYLFRGNTSAVSKSSKIDRPRRPATQSAHHATAAPMLRAYVDRGLGAVPARYR